MFSFVLAYYLTSPFLFIYIQNINSTCSSNAHVVFLLKVLSLLEFFVKICLVNQFHALQITLTNKDCDMEIKLWKNKTLSLLKLHRNIVA